MSAQDSPWWAEVSRYLPRYGAKVGEVYGISELTEMMPCYPTGNHARPHTVARRLLELNAIELVERGPNGSLSRGARYRILPERAILPPAEDPVMDNADFLEKAVERMTREMKGKR